MRFNICKISTSCAFGICLGVVAIASPGHAQTPLFSDTEMTPVLEPTTPSEVFTSSQADATPILTAQSSEDTAAPTAPAPANPRIRIPSRIFPFAESMQQ